MYIYRVVLATSFIHILPHAIQTLTDPCLPDSWTVYGAYGGLFAMLAALGMQLIEFIAHQRYLSMKNQQTHLTGDNSNKKCASNEQTHDDSDGSIEKKSANTATDQFVSVEDEQLTRKKQVNDETVSTEHRKQINDTTKDTNKTSVRKKPVFSETNNLVMAKESVEMQQTDHRNQIPKKKQTSNKNDNPTNREETHLPEKKDDNECIAIEISPIDSATRVDTDPYEGESGHHHGSAFQDDVQQQKISAYLLELGIALHSALIGLTLGTTTESFIALFIALCFHQFFEAMALGAQIARAKMISIKSAMYMTTFFSLTTSIGIAIGIGIHFGTYNPKSVSSLLTTGILYSLAAGVLIYVALVNLISAEMGSHAYAFHTFSNRLKCLYFIALYLGVGTMAVIARWA